MAEDPFTLLGAPRRFDLDPALVQSRWLALSAALHPDRAGSAAADHETARRAACLNDARRVLMDPEARANALLAILGGPAKEADNALPAGFLAEMMEAREGLEAATDARDGAGVERWRLWALEQRTARIARVASLFKAAEQGGPADPRALRAIRTELNAWRYIERMLERADEA